MIIHFIYKSYLQKLPGIKPLVRMGILLCLFFTGISISRGQAVLQAWGNISGIRVQGELMGFETSLRVAGNGWTNIRSTGKEQQNPKFSRDGSRRIVNTRLGSISFTESVTDLGPGEDSVTVRFLAATDTAITGIFFCIHIPLKEYNGGTLRFDNGKSLDIAGLKPDSQGELLKIAATRLLIYSGQRQLKIESQKKGIIFVRSVSGLKEEALEIYFPIQAGNLYAGQSQENSFFIRATGSIDKNDIHLKLDARQAGRSFAGIGGNFRIQNLKNDPQVIDYCLKNMRVAWGRVEMPWRFWQPEKNTDPITTAKSGKLDAHVQRAMEMAQKLQQQGIPVILTDWSAPDWAIIGNPVFSPRQDGIWGNPLNPDSISAIYKSIGDYIQYLDDQYGVQIRFFSFNESDLGIYVRQTGTEHADLIKGLGKYFLTRGLKTKILLGDNSDATTYTFIDPALHDIATHPFIGAVSFHSWRGWDTETLMHWTDASRQIDLPLIVGEGSIDAAAWAYPEIFLEQTYAMEEINLYIRLMAVCQPLSILQWQLTSDYSPLTGGGIFGKGGPLEPTQRFWNLKQLASTPAGLNYLPVDCRAPSITCSSLGDIQTQKYVFHIVNSGAERKVIIQGIPEGVRTFKSFSTSQTMSMQEGSPVSVVKNEVSFLLPAGCFTTLICN